MLFPKSITYISKYRTEIMGFAILGVMLAHIKTICDFPDSIIGKIFGLLCYSVFTGGFIFMSGLGLYSSFSQNNNIKQFYFKRIKRLLIPYWIISTPYFIYTDLFSGSGLHFIEHITTLSFWIHGNYSGMWYVSASVLLYMLYPFVYKLIYEKGNNPLLVSLLFILIWFIAMFVLRKYAYSYYDKTNVALNTIPLFVIGSLTMSWIISKKDMSLWQIVGILIGGGILLCFDNGYWAVINIVSIYLLGVFFHLVVAKEYMKVILNVFQWLGIHTLELYILHLLIYYTLNHIYGIGNQELHIIIGVLSGLLLCSPIHRFTKMIIDKI